MLSNLLQELALARDHGRKRIVLDEARLLSGLPGPVGACSERAYAVQGAGADVDAGLDPHAPPTSYFAGPVYH